jgi:lysophospholipase L1-like esterase
VNQADVEASTLGFEPAYGGLALARSTAGSVSGTSSLQITATAAGQLAVRTTRGWTPALPGEPYSAAVAVRTGASVAPGHRVLLQLRVYDAAGTQLSVVNGPWTTVSATSWTRTTTTTRAPTSAATLSLFLVVETAAANEVYLADTWGAWRSATVPDWNLPAPSSSRVAVFLGDSYSAGTGASSSRTRWTSVVSTARGWLEANLARGGTGYVKTSSTSGCGLTYCPTFLEMAADAVAAAPDVVVVAGGRNDLLLASTNPAAVHQAVLDTFARLRQGLPTTTIYAVTPMWDSSTPPAVLQDLRTWVIEAAAAQGATLVDGADGWLLGHPEWISADGVHPNDAGHAQLAQHVLAALA